MKKQLLTVVAVCVLSSTAMAAWVEGTINSITQYPDGSIVMVLKKSADDSLASSTVSGTDTVKKNMLAMMLTAQASSKKVNMSWSGSWNGLSILSQ